MAYPERFHQLAKKVNNWGRWGPDDEIGTVNLITPEVRRRAAACARTGRAFSLALPLSEAEGIQTGVLPGRINPVRAMVQLNTPLTGDPAEFCSSDDMVVMGLQAATHWDGLGHVSYEGRLYNGNDASSVTVFGASVCGIHKIRTLVTRGVLLDVARALGTTRLDGAMPSPPPTSTPPRLRRASRSLRGTWSWSAPDRWSSWRAATRPGTGRRHRACRP